MTKPRADEIAPIAVWERSQKPFVPSPCGWAIGILSVAADLVSTLATDDCRTEANARERKRDEIRNVLGQPWRAVPYLKLQELRPPAC